MSGCNYFDLLSRDEIAELYAGADGPYDTHPRDPLLAQPYADQVRRTLSPPRTERQAA